jgi:hypothetical protein
MGELKLYGMKAPFDELLATAVKRQHEPHALSSICSPPRSTRSKAGRSSTSSLGKRQLGEDIADFQFDWHGKVVRSAPVLDALKRCGALTDN